MKNVSHSKQNINNETMYLQTNREANTFKMEYTLYTLVYICILLNELCECWQLQLTVQKLKIVYSLGKLL